MIPIYKAIKIKVIKYGIKTTLSKSLNNVAEYKVSKNGGNATVIVLLKHFTANVEWKHTVGILESS